MSFNLNILRSIIKDDHRAAPINFHTLPIILKEAISKRPSILEENPSFGCIYSSSEVLQILTGEGNFLFTLLELFHLAGKCASKASSPTKSVSSMTARHPNSGSTVAPVKLTLKQSQPSDGSSNGVSSGVYSVTAVEPLKISIKRAPLMTAHETSKKSRSKRRSKTSSGSQNLVRPFSLLVSLLFIYFLATTKLLLVGTNNMKKLIVVINY